MTTKLPFTELAVRRAIKAARAEGVRVTGVRVYPDGSITVYEAPVNVAALPTQAQHAPSSDFEDFQA